jgi:two-component system sensor histidine kinase/response regulator
VLHPFILSNGVATVLSVGTDVTDRRKVETQLKGAYELALNAQAARSQFLSNIVRASRGCAGADGVLTRAVMQSHEIRTPMNGVIGMLRLALEEPLGAEVNAAWPSLPALCARRTPPQAKEFVESAFVSANSLIEVVNMVLDLAKVTLSSLACLSTTLLPPG